MAAVVFWIAAAVVVYVFVGYPVLLAVLSAFVRRRPTSSGAMPTVSLLVPARNEAEVIAEKVRNSLALDYPADRLEIVVVSDGSTDGTAAIAARAGGDRVVVRDHPVWRGKMAVLNDTLPTLRGDIVVFSDAACRLDPQALRALVAGFADPSVGAVSGVYVVRKATDAEFGVQEDFYWHYETFLKGREARLGTVLGAHGSLYAIRRALYPYPSPATINDDYVIPVRIVQQGYRVAYEPRAIAYEDARQMDGFGRRVRVMAGNLQQIREIGPLFRPLRPTALFFFFSHKVGRLVAPWALIALALSNAALVGMPFYRATALVQIVFYGLALAGARWRGRSLVVRLPYYFCLVNAAALVATGRALVRPDRFAWR
jgi:glycosyltransferase involved in cell wall biosynthesis